MVSHQELEKRVTDLEKLATNPKLMLFGRLGQAVAPIIMTAILAVTGYAASQFEGVKDAVVRIDTRVGDLASAQRDSNSRIERLEDRLISAPGAVIVPLPPPVTAAPH